MQPNERVFELKTHAGQPWTVGDVAITPESQALILRWAGGGFVWNRPVAALIERGGETERVPIADVTLWARLTLVGFLLIFMLGTIVRSIGKGRRADE